MYNLSVLYYYQALKSEPTWTSLADDAGASLITGVMVGAERGGEGMDLDPEDGDIMPGAVTLSCFSTTILLFSDEEWNPILELVENGIGTSLE